MGSDRRCGPRFEVAELHGDSLVRFWIQAGRRGMQPLEGQAADGGVLLCDAEFKVRAAVLDHGTPVLAFAFEPNVQINVRKDRLAALDLTPGPWLTELKRRFAGGRALAPSPCQAVEYRPSEPWRRRC
jgi:ribonuclease Z